MRNPKSSALWIFLIGLFIRTQVHVIGYMGLSEFFVFLVAPIICIQDWPILKRSGFGTLFAFLFAVMIGCCLSSVYNGTHIQLFLRGFAACYSVFAFAVVFARLLRGNIGDVKWFFLGAAISGIISIYIMQGTALTRSGADINLRGEAAVEEIKNGALFWVGRIGPFIQLPIQMFYLKCPLLYSIIAPLFVGGMALVSSRGSGRSVFLTVVVSVLLIAFGRKRIDSIRRMMRMLPLYACVLMVSLVPIKMAYSYAASTGMLGEHAERKYNDQTKRGTDLISMLISGRTDFFIGLYACCQQPIMGYGPWPQDVYGYRAYFYSKYGTDDELKNVHEYSDLWALKTIPAHSHIVGFWLEYGLIGLLFWFYVLYHIFHFLRKNMDVIPHLYGYIALALPGYVWGIFFSPFGSRASTAMFMVVFLTAESIRRGRMRLSDSEMREIWEANKR